MHVRFFPPRTVAHFSLSVSEKQTTKLQNFRNNLGSCWSPWRRRCTRAAQRGTERACYSRHRHHYSRHHHNHHYCPDHRPCACSFMPHKLALAHDYLPDGFGPRVQLGTEFQPRETPSESLIEPPQPLQLPEHKSEFIRAVRRRWRRGGDTTSALLLSLSDCCPPSGTEG